MIGDYVAGVNHVLPTGGTARFASALRVADFQKHVHVVSLDRDALDRVGAVRHACSPTSEGLDAHARLDPRPGDRRDATPTRVRSRATTCARSRATTRAQVDVPVRLNTNESPYPPPPEFVAEWLAALGDAALPPLSRPRRRASSAPRSRELLGQPAGAHLPAPTAATRCCRRSCSPTAGTAARALVFEPTYALHAHIARITATEVVEGERDDATSRSISTPRPR